MTATSPTRTAGGTTAGGSGFVRDRLTWFMYLVMGTYGYFLYGFGPSMTLLRREEGTSRAIAALHGTALAIGSVVAGLVLHRLTARFGRGAVLRSATALFAVGLVVLVSGPVLGVTLLGALLCGTFGAIMVTGTAPVLATRHGLHAAAAMTEANGIGTVLGIATPLLLGASVSLGLGWRPALLVAVGLVGAVLWFGRPVAVPFGDPAPAVRRTDGTALPATFWLAWAATVMVVAVEFTLSFWSADLLATRTGASPAAASAGLFAMVGGMSAGRFVGARMLLRRSVDRMLLGALGVSLAGFAVLWAAAVYPLALAGLLLAGLGMSMHYPLAMSRCLTASGGRTDLAASRTSLGTGLAIGLAPFGLGVVADSVGTHTAMLITPGCAAAAIVLVLAGRGRGGPQPETSAQPA